MQFLRRFKRLRFAGQVVAGVLRAVGDRNLDLISAGVAFWSMMAIFPAVAAVIALWGFLADPEMIQGQLDALRPFVPEDAFNLLNRQVRLLILTTHSTLGWATIISTGAALWSTRAGVGALLRGLNAAYDTTPRAGIWSTLWALVMTVALIGVSLFAMASVLVAPVVLSLLPLGAQTQAALIAVRWLLTVLVILLALGLIYRYGPNHRGARRPAWISPGAIVALGIWAIASAGFTLYLANFGNYNRIYGSIGAVIALLMWFFISAFTVLMGAAWNAETARLKGAAYRVRRGRFRRTLRRVRNAGLRSPPPAATTPDKS